MPETGHDWDEWSRSRAVTWALDTAISLEIDAREYEGLIECYGPVPLWVDAVREDREAAAHLRTLVYLSRRPPAP